MFNLYKRTLITLRKSICGKNDKIKHYNSKMITSADLYRNLYIHNGNSLVWRSIPFTFLGRCIKFNVLFKKPLVRPQKKKNK